MSRYQVLLTFLTIFLFSFSAHAEIIPENVTLESLYRADVNEAKEKLSKGLFNKLMENVDYDLVIPAIIVMKDQADISKSSSIKSKKKKTKYVVKTLWKHAKSSQESIANYLDGFRKLNYRQFYIFNGLVLYNPTADLLLELRKRSDVEKIYYNPVVKNNKLPSANSIIPNLSTLMSRGNPAGATKGIKHIKADEMWNMGHKGKSVVVGVQDTGVELLHPALVEKYRGKKASGFNHDYSWHDTVHHSFDGSSNKCGYDSISPCDDSEHGTHVTGTVVGGEGQNIIGVAPKAKWVGCRNMDNGNGTPASYIECYEFFMAPYPQSVKALDSFKNLKPKLSVDVISNSWGCPKSEGCDQDEMLLAVRAIKAAGIVNVLSAGNDGRKGCSTINSQASSLSDYTFSVGAINASNDQIARFSSRGPSTYDGKVGPDVVAPGVKVRSSVPGGGYDGTFSGTSMAGPHVAGLVALMISARPEIRGDVDRIEKAIIAGATAKTIDSARNTCGGLEVGVVPNNTFGHGMINSIEAFNNI